MKTSQHVLKANKVRFEGTFHLGLTPAASAGGDKRTGGSVAPRIRIAENHSDYAIVEVLCSCGKTTYVRCDYNSAVASSAGAQPVQR
jgi:hypothetical protein